MGGVAGHAGLFLTASDLARYARMLLNLGELDGVRIFKPETVKLMTSVQTPPNVTGRRGLGWDIDTGYSGPRGEVFPLGSYGHTGWTGTSIWIDPFSKTFVIFSLEPESSDGEGQRGRVAQATGHARGARPWRISILPTCRARCAPRCREHQRCRRESEAAVKRQNLRTLNGIDVSGEEQLRPAQRQTRRARHESHRTGPRAEGNH